jgi:hypothetical protein
MEAGESGMLKKYLEIELCIYPCPILPGLSQIRTLSVRFALQSEGNKGALGVPNFLPDL